MQMSFFDGTQPFRIDKPIRLIELFGGYGSQALALKYLGVPFEHWKMSEWAIKSIQAYKDLHAGDDDTDYSAGLTETEIKAWLLGRISSNYSEPLNETQINRLTESAVRKIYNNMQATQNLGSITAITGGQLEITDTDKYCYILTYSFPCQDLSSAGKGAGMEKGSGTRSGLLWEVERLLTECDELPQVLLMENVPEVVGTKNMPQFAKWQAFLDGLGYKTRWQVLNTKDFGIPQNRARCFAVSVLGDYFYEHPKGYALDIRLKDVLEKQVDEKYYLKPETIEALNLHKERHDAKGHGFGWKPTDGGGTQRLLRPKADIDPTATLLLSNQGKRIEKCVDIACTIIARDYKGFGNQPMTAFVETKKTIVMTRPHGYNCGGIEQTDIFPTVRKSSTMDGNNGVVEWKK